VNRLPGWTALAFDILTNDAQRRSASSADVVGAGPEVIAPQVFLHLDRMFLAQHARRHSLERIHQLGELHRRRELNQQVDMVVLAVELNQSDSKVATRFPHGLFAGCEHGVSKHTTAVLGNKHQMSMARPSGVPPSAYIRRYSHNTNTTMC